MAAGLLDTTWYVNYGNGTSTGYYAVPVWTTLAVKTVGAFIRPFTTPALGNERLYVCTQAGTTGAVEPTWTYTRGAIQTTDGTVIWQECSGQPSMCGDLTNTTRWAALKAAYSSSVLGQVVTDVAADYYFICTAAGTLSASEPTWVKTAGLTTTDSGTTWTCLGAVGGFTTAFGAPHARLANAFTATWGAAGNTFAIASNHAETQGATLTLNSPGTAASPCAAYCISSTTTLASPTLATTATISTTGAFSIKIVTVSSFTFYYGIGFSAGSGSSNASILICPSGGSAGVSEATYFEHCSFILNNTSTSPRIYIGTDQNSAFDEQNNFTSCSFIFGSTSQNLRMYGGFNNLFSCSFAPSGVAPTTLFSLTGCDCGGVFTVRDCDLSTITGTILSVTNNASQVFLLENCVLHSSVALTTGTFASIGAAQFKLHNCDSANTNYRYYYGNYAGVVQQETTIVRTGGATDGTTPISWNITSSANAKFVQPFVSEEIAQWSDLTSGSHTATFYLTSNTSLDNSMFWAEIETLGTSGFPLGVITNSRVTPLGSASGLTSDSSTWGGSITNKYKIIITYTAVNKGPVKARFYLATPTTTVYVDPYIYIS